jgi:hypothetical protein
MSLVAFVLFEKLQKIKVSLKPEVLHEAIDLPVAVFRMAVLDPFRILYQVHIEITCITKKT